LVVYARVRPQRVEPYANHRHRVIGVAANLPGTAYLSRSAGLAIAAAIAFTLFAEPVLVDAGRPEFCANVAPDWPLAGLAIATAVAFSSLPEPVLVFAGRAKFATLRAAAAVIDPDSAGPDFDRLGKGRSRRHRQNRESGRRQE
jgi:hypothetical protein